MLVLGTGPYSEQARRSLSRQGIAVAQRFTKTVTHLVADDTVAETDPRLERARREGVAALPSHFLARYSDEPPRELPITAMVVAPRYEPALDAIRTVVASAPRAGAFAKPDSGHGVGFIGDLIWAALPLLTLGFAAPVVMGRAAYRLKSTALGWSAAGYGLAIIMFIGIISAYESPDAIPPVANFIAAMAFFSTWLGATVQAYLVSLLIREADRPTAAADTADMTNSQRGFIR